MTKTGIFVFTEPQHIFFVSSTNFLKYQNNILSFNVLYDILSTTNILFIFLKIEVEHIRGMFWC